MRTSRDLRVIVPSLLVTCLALPAGVSARVPEPKERPGGAWGQDDVRRMVRWVENDADVLLAAIEERLAELGRPGPAAPELLAELSELESWLDEVRDGYDRDLRSRTDEALEELEARLVRIGELWPHVPVGADVDRLWKQLLIDARRLGREHERGDRTAPGWMPRLGEIGGVDVERRAVAEVEDLSDNLKRHLLGTELDEPETADLVLKKGRVRHVVVHSRLEDALLELEEAADELKRRYRRRRGPGEIDEMVRTMERAFRIIDTYASDVSTDDESRREWRELVPSYRVVLDAARVRSRR